MALSVKSTGVKRVPWFSISEWQQVYQQIYSNDLNEQKRGYETLLIWKARMPKLPMGVDGTLSLIQVCLRDREWSPKINSGELPMSYEHDLCLLYSITIMRFLNYVTNIGHTKQTSMFRIARQLGIPDWIVNLRHDAAHGHQLPSIDLFRIAVNMLLTWLHDEYWVPEAAAFENDCQDQHEDESSQLSDCLVNLIELWMAVGLYITAGYETVSKLPDEHLCDTLKELRIFAKASKRDLKLKKINKANGEDNYYLVNAKIYLLTEIYSLLSRRNSQTFDKTTVVLNTIFNSDAFLATQEFTQLYTVNDDNKSKKLSKVMIKLWQPFITMLHERAMLDALVYRLIKFINSENNDIKDKKLCAALWLDAIAKGLVMLKITQREMQTLEQSLDSPSNKQITPKMLESKLKNMVKNANPHLSDGMWFSSFISEIPEVLKDVDFFVDNFALHPNEFTIKFIQPLLELTNANIDTKKKLLNIVAIYTKEKSLSRLNSLDDGGNNANKIYDYTDLIKLTGSTCENPNTSMNNQDGENSNEIEIEIEENIVLADKTVRNTNWKLASSDVDWASSEIGILPWQVDALTTLKTDDVTPDIITTEENNTTIVIPGVIDVHNTSRKVQWDKVLRNKQRSTKKKNKRFNINADIVMNKAIAVVTKKKH